MVVKRYRLHTGTWAWVLHRISGVVLALYLPLHIWVVYHVSKGREEFNEMMAAVSGPAFKVFEIGLLAAILFHAFNGLRIIGIDLDWLGTARAQRVAFWVAGLATLPILGYGFYVIVLTHS